MPAWYALVECWELSILEKKDVNYYKNSGGAATQFATSPTESAARPSARDLPAQKLTIIIFHGKALLLNQR